MKIVKINESQRERLFEAYSEGFSFKTLSSLSENQCKQYEYCLKTLGRPIGYGSSRTVFTLSDNIVLKLAASRREAGIEQNKLEYQIYDTFKSPLLARVFDKDEHFTYIICEHVITAEAVDFEKILGLPFYDQYEQNTNFSRNVVGYDKYFKNLKKWHEKNDISLYSILSYIESNYVLDEPYTERIYDDIINNSKWLKELTDFVAASGISDFCSIENFGLVNRNGQPSLVLLDAGMNLDLWERHYSN